MYCEKPMIHLYSDGPEIIEETARSTKADYPDWQPTRELDDLRKGQANCSLLGLSAS